MNEYLFKLTLLFIPGVVSVSILDHLIVHREWKLEHWIRFSVLFSLLAYGLYSFGLWIAEALSHSKMSTNFSLSLNRSTANLDFVEIGIVSVIGIILAGMAARGIEKNHFFRLVKFWGITSLDSPYSVFHNIMKNDLNQSWVRIRDQKNNLVYQGWVQRYSDDPTRQEFYLRDVKVFDNKSGKYYYDVDGLFLAFCKDYHTVEREVQEGN